MNVQAGQDGGQAHVALLEIGNSGHDLLVSHVAAGLVQLHSQLSQLVGVGGVVAHHVLHQSQQLVHGSVLALGAAAVAVAAAAVVMVMMVMIVVMMMLVAMIVQMVMGVAVLMGMGVAVVGVLVGVGMGMLVIVAAAADMIFVNMHGKFSFYQYISTNYTHKGWQCQTIYFCIHNPPRGLRGAVKWRIITQKEATAMDHYHDHDHEHEHHHSHDHHHHDHEYLHAHGIAHSHGHVHENQKAVINRLARAIGHLEKVKRMVEEGYDCSEVLIQLAAVRSALDNTGKVILKDHMRHCMVDAVAAGDTEAIEDLCEAIDKFMK